MRKFVIGCLLLFSYAVANAQQEKVFATTSYTLHSNILKEDRKITVYKPTDLVGPFSLIYLLDGEWNFEVTQGILDLFIRWNRIPAKVALVSVHNQGTRTRDMTPTEDDVRFPGSGGGREFLGFLEEELVPFIEREVGESSDRLLIGHSFGGLFGLYTLLEKPDLFDGYLAISPSTWYGDNLLFGETYISKLQGLDANIFLFISTGEYDRGNVKSNKDYVKWLTENTTESGLIVHYERNLRTDHFSNVLPSIEKGLGRYYPGPELKADMLTVYNQGNIPALSEWLELTREKYGNRFVEPSEVILDIARDLNQQQKSEEVLALLLWYEPIDPDNGNLQYFIGAISQREGLVEQARKHYDLALKTNLPQRMKTVISRNLELLNQ